MITPTVEIFIHEILIHKKNPHNVKVICLLTELHYG